MVSLSYSAKSHAWLLKFEKTDKKFTGKDPCAKIRLRVGYSLKYFSNKGIFSSIFD